MHSSKLVELIKALDPSELKKMKIFLDHPLMHPIKQREKAILLFQLIRSHYPAMDSEALTKEKIFAQCFPDTKYGVNKMDKLMASLLKVVKQFIVWDRSGWSDNKIQQELTLAKFYREKNMEKSFHQSILQIKKMQRSAEQRDKEYYFWQYQIESEITNQAGLYNQRKEDLNLPQTLKSIDAFYLVAKLEYACWSLAQGISVSLEVEGSLLLLDHLLEVLPKDYLYQNPLIGLYYHAYKLLRKGADKKTLDDLAILLDDSAKFIPLEQLKALQAIYRSFMVKEYNAGERKVEEVFVLYKRHLDAGYLYHEGGIFPALIRNLVGFGLRAKAFDWVRQFIESHRYKIIGTKFSEDVYFFNLGEYFFACQDYEKTLALLNDYGEDTYYKIAAKKLELKVFFELQDDLLESKMTAFKVYIHRMAKKKLPRRAYQRNNNFINLLRQINAPQIYKKTKKIDKLILKIQSLGPIAEREWLLEKLEQMK